MEIKKINKNFQTKPNKLLYFTLDVSSAKKKIKRYKQFYIRQPIVKNIIYSNIKNLNHTRFVSYFSSIPKINTLLNTLKILFYFKYSIMYFE